MAGSQARAGFGAAERRDLIDRYRRAYEAKDRAVLVDRDEAAAERARAEMAEIGRAYAARVPILAVSRDPTTGDVFETSLDTFDVDGLWWAYEHDYRPYVERPPGMFAWHGSLTPDGPWPAWTVKAMVGPEPPFVLPRILEHPAITAVVSSVLVGEHVGFPVVYFAQGPHPDIERVDDWGQAWHQYLRPDGSPTVAHSVEADAEKDFELGPWFDSGKLLWIAPGDAALTLRRGREGNPYLDLPGERRRRYLQEGRTWLA